MEVVLFVFKDEPWFKEHIDCKFNKHYKTHYIFLKKIIKLSRCEIIKKINKFILSNKIQNVFFDIDYSSYIDANFISEIKSKNKIMLSFDVEENYKKIRRNLKCFTHLFLCEPKFVYKLKRDGYNPIFFPLETNQKIFYKMKKVKKIYDILFFGELKENRKVYLKYLNKKKFKKNILINKKKEISNYQLNKIINQSRIVLNFSAGANKYSKKEYSQFKGRVLISGLSGTFCLSEKYDSSKYLFKNAYPSFKNIETLNYILEDLLKNEKKLKNLTKNYSISCLKYSDFNYFEKIKNFLSISNKKERLKLSFYETVNVLKISSKNNSLKILIKNFLDIEYYFLNNFGFKNFLLFSIVSILMIIFSTKKILKNVSRII